jgi:DnaJ-domain-containing protein 1
MHSASQPIGMAASARPDIFALMDAYRLLGVDYSADAADIRRAHRRQARHHHPDMFPAGSVEQQQATARMTAINEAYQLARDAPLRYHRISKATDPDTVWTDSELDEAIRRAKAARAVDHMMTVALFAVYVVFVPFLMWSLIPALPVVGQIPVMIVLSLISASAFVMIFGWRAWRVMIQIELALAILRVFASGRLPF